MIYKSLTVLLFILLTVSNSKSQNPLDDIEWAPPAWIANQEKTSQENLMDLLLVLENEAAQEESLWFMEYHFASLKTLLQAYPPASELIEEMITVFSNYDGAGSLQKYLLGNQQLLMAYESDGTGVISYVAYTLPENFNPEIAYPLYTWGTEGRPSTYPGGIHHQFEEQVTGGSLQRGPSSRFKEGYTIIPGGLGQRSYTGDCAADFFQGMDLFISKHNTDRRKYYLGGFSNGGRATWLLSTEEGAMQKYNFAALAMFAANVDASSLISTRTARISEASVWLGAGKLDGTYLPKARAINVHLIVSGQAPEVYREVEGVGHEWTYSVQDSMYSFLQSKEYLWPGEPPGAPSDLSSPELTENQIKLLWTDQSDNELYFVVERKKAGDENFEKLGYSGPDRDFYFDRGLTPGTEYVYRVYAYNESGDSEYSALLSVITEGETLFNVAEGKDITVLDPDSEEDLYRLVDGNPSTEGAFRWSASGFPQTVSIDLGNKYDINIFKVYAFESRDYLYTIKTRLEGEEFQMVVDRSSNTGAAVYIDEVDVSARYIQFEVSGAASYTGTWISIGELEAYGRLSELTAGIRERTEASVEFGIYPVPTRDLLFFDLDMQKKLIFGSEEPLISIYTPTGRRVINLNYHGNPVDVSDLQTGFYYLQVSFENRIWVSKMIKE